MKKITQFMAAAALTMVAASCGTKQEAQKVLVLYYSQTSNTRTVAEEIATRLGADIEEIVPVTPYDGDFQATIDRCMQEREAGVAPEIQLVAADLSKYDVVFVGYPVWFGTFAPPMGTFLDKADLSGKKVVPFCTFGSGGLESSTKDLTAKQPGAEILPGYGVRAARMDAVAGEIDQFLKAGGFVEGEYFQPEPFAEQQPVGEEETAIFDAAVGDYPMIHAKASTVASRAVPGGTEYLFTAVDLPREAAAEGDEAPVHEIQVYVIVAEGKAPVFTRVVR